MNILIIEDEILIQKSLQKLIQKRGHTVSVTASGIEAIEMIKQNEFDRIVCDLMLSDITGFDIIEDIKSKYTMKEISQKLIIMTAYSSEQVLEKAKQYNCTVLNKPFDDIQKAIDTFIGDQQ